MVERPHSGFSVSAMGLITQEKDFPKYYGYSVRILKYRCYNNSVSIIQKIQNVGAKRNGGEEE